MLDVVLVGLVSKGQDGGMKERGFSAAARLARSTESKPPLEELESSLACLFAMESSELHFSFLSPSLLLHPYHPYHYHIPLDLCYLHRLLHTLAPAACYSSSSPRLRHDYSLQLANSTAR